MTGAGNAALSSVRPRAKARSASYATSGDPARRIAKSGDILDSRFRGNERSVRRVRAAIITGVIATLALAACSGSDKSEPDPNILPKDYRKEIVATLTTALDDPTNVRDAFVSEPFLVPVGREQRYAVCVRYNARDLARRYVGSKERIAYFFAGHLNQLVDATPGQCGNAAYKPFPEAEKICFANRCT